MGLFGPSQKEKALQDEINRLNALLTPEHRSILDLQTLIRELEDKKKNTENQLFVLQQQLDSCSRELEQKRNQVYDLDDCIDMQQYGIYKPAYSFANSDLYKERLKAVRDSQKLMIKQGRACSGNMNWTVNGSKSQGNKMVKDMQKLLLRSFNLECDNAVDNVKVSNFDKCKERIYKSCEQISKLGSVMSISITTGYVNLKIEELCLALDFQQKKEEEKERIREARERQREEAKAQKEIEEARKKLEKEQTHYKNALKAVEEQLIKNPDDSNLLAKKRELEYNIEDTDRAIKDVDYREANKRAGYVYVISNIGAFGENVYKIGMTRRLDPMDRVNELGDASVPFNFDVHALIFTEDAPRLEAALHNAFETQKINKINSRREFFRVSLDEVKRVVRQNFDKTVEWVDVPQAEQFRQSLVMSRGTGGTIMPQTDILPQSAAVPENRQADPYTDPNAERSSPIQKISVQSIIDNSEQIAKSTIPDCKCKTEDSADYLKLHVYTSDGKKIGIVKASKSDLSIQLRYFRNGTPVSYDLKSEDELRNYL